MAERWAWAESGWRGTATGRGKGEKDEPGLPVG